MINADRKAIEFIGNSLDILREFPKEIKTSVGFALDQSQLGGKAPNVKPLKGFSGAGVLEVFEDFDGDTYRAIYTVRFTGVVFVLHCFQKKSTKGISTPKHHIDLLKQRLQTAEEIYRKEYLA